MARSLGYLARSVATFVSTLSSTLVWLRVPKSLSRLLEALIYSYSLPFGTPQVKLAAVFFTDRCAPRLAPSRGSTGAARIARMSPPTRAKGGSPPHSAGKRSAARRAARAPGRHPLRRANALKPKAAPFPKHPQFHPPAAPGAPGS